MSEFVLSERSLDRLKGVHPKLIMVVQRAIELTPLDFGVLEGKRTIEKQKEYFESGASETMDSYHLPQLNGEYDYENGVGHAVDLGVYYDGRLSWHMGHYVKLFEVAMRPAAIGLGVPIIWGGDWDDDGDYEEHEFKDGPHFQLPRRAWT